MAQASDGQQREEAMPAEDFDCSICMKLLLEPVTVACGHTFCRACLEECLSYRSVCAVCRAPITSGQAVNDIIKRLIADRFPQALEERLREQEEEIQRGEGEADEARRREVRMGSPDSQTLSSPSTSVLLPLLEIPLHVSRPCFLPHCRVEMDFLGSPALLQHALEGGNRRLGALEAEVDGQYDEAARALGVCLEIEAVDRQPSKPPRVRLMGKFRFWLVAAPQPHASGSFKMGRCEAFFDEPIPLRELAVTGGSSSTDTHEAGEAHESVPEIAASALQFLEAQLVSVGQAGRRAFHREHGSIPGATGTGAASATAFTTSAAAERLSFWLLGAILLSEEERSHWRGVTDTKARLDYCSRKLKAAGSRPILDLPGARSLMHPGQSALGSLMLLLAIVALLLAKFLGFFERGSHRGHGWSRSSSHGRERGWDGQDAWVFYQMFR